MPETTVEEPDKLESGKPDSGQGKETPGAGAAPLETPAGKEAKTPEGGETPPSKTEKGEAMVPSARLREETEKRQKLETELEELRALKTDLDTIGGRFGKGSKEYLQSLREFYDQQDRVKRLQEKGIQPGTVEAKLEELETWKAQKEEQERLQPYVQQLQKELGEVKANTKFAVFSKNWEKWEKRILEAMRADPNQTATEIAQEFLDLLDSEKAAYLKSKTDEGKRVIEGGGAGGAIGTKPEGPTKIKNFDQVIERVVKAQRAQAE